MTGKQKRGRALERQIERIGARLNAWEQINRRLSTARLIAGLSGIAAGILALTLPDAPIWWVVTLAAALIFAPLVILHTRLKRGIADFAGWRQIKRTHLARMTLDWAALPRPLPGSRLAEHPFEQDLDITGEFSLHRLLNTAVTRAGGERLRAWLLATAPDPAVIARRQTLVRELRSLPIFRDKLILRGGAQGQSAGIGWLNSATRVQRRTVLILTVLALVNLVLLAGDAAGLIAPIWRLTIPAVFIAGLIAGRGSGDVFQQALEARALLESVGGVFHLLETTRPGDRPALAALIAPFHDARERPSTELARVGRVLFMAALRSNLFLWLPLNLFLPFDLLVAVSLESARVRLREHLPAWLDVWHELEALAGLATYAYLNPDAVFPVIDADAVFTGQALGHPLIKDEGKVRNDFALDRLGQVVIITGSNMAGKSSFLRTLGLALVLTYAGGVVDAAALTVAPFRLFTCIRVSDSVTEGFSYFYAEVKRLKALLTALHVEGDYPLFSLIDEIFKGTNNRERLIGSRAYIKALAGQRGVSVISTHDLELVTLADETPGVSNAHFREEVIDGGLVFDYRLRPGPCPTTNALKIMQMAGLPVGE